VDESLDRVVVMSLHPRNLSTKEFSQKVAGKNPEEKHKKMDSGSTKTKIQGDESKDVKPPAFGHDMTKMEKRRKNTQRTHHHRKIERHAKLYNQGMI
jgi:hypothetical protein